MSEVTVEVPPLQRAALLHELLTLYAVKADALHHTASAYRTARGSLDPLLVDQRELGAVHALIEQLGWRLDAPPRAVTVTGESYPLAEVARAVLECAVGDLSETVSAAGTRPDKIVEGTGPAIKRVSSAFAFLRQTYGHAAPAVPRAR